MLLERLGTRLVACRQAVVDVPQMIGRDRRRIDVECLDGVDELEYVLDLRPAFELEQDVTARAHARPPLIGLVGRDGAPDFDARDDRADAGGGPAGRDVERLVGQESDSKWVFAGRPDYTKQK